MILISNATIKDKDMREEVTLVFTANKKIATCGCGRSWEPMSADDYRCRDCDRKGRQV